MRWKPKNIGDTRRRLRFALLPVRCEDGLMHWLEYVDVEEEYSQEWAEFPYWKIKKAISISHDPQEEEKEAS